MSEIELAFARFDSHTIADSIQLGYRNKSKKKVGIRVQEMMVRIVFVRDGKREEDKNLNGVPTMKGGE